MASTTSLRPPRPSRTVPDAPAPISLDSPASPDPDDIHPLASPLVDSPVHEQLSILPEQSTPSLPIPNDYLDLTPIRAHYLKKELIYLQFQREFDALVTAPTNHISTFSYLGHPFTPPPKDAPHLDLPFLRFVFRRFILSFPFLAAAPKDFFPDKVQPFLASLLSRNLSPTSVLDQNPEESEEATRHRLLNKVERNVSMLLTSGTKLVEPEQVVRLTQVDLNRLEMLARKRTAREKRLRDSFDVNIVCIRSIAEKKRMRSKVHEEFIIRTRRRGQTNIFVSRRYGDFRTLADELQKAHPNEAVPQPPPKDRSFVNMTISSYSPSLSTGFPSSPSIASSSGNLAQSPPPPNVPPNPPVSPVASQVGRTPTKLPLPRIADDLYDPERNNSADSFNMGSPNSITSTFEMNNHGGGSWSEGLTQHAIRLSREKNRLTLRSYLHILLSSPVIASSPVIKSFLLSGPTRLTEEELADARRREEADRMREDGRIRFAREITARVEGLRDTVLGVKGELLGKDGLMNIFATIKDTSDVRDLPQNYRAVLEWARISLASTVFHHFVAADNASESFASLKRIHGLMPYFMLKAALRISNPMGMIRGVFDLFLAQPFGGRSLLQRMFTGSLAEEVKGIQEVIEAVKAKVNDLVMCEKVRLYVYAPREIQGVYKADAAEEKMHVLAVVLRSGEEPALSRSQLQRVMYAHRAHAEYVKYTESLSDSDDDEGPQDEEAWLFEDLTVLAKLYARLKDREQLIDLIFEGTTADLLKDIITIFYTPLAQVYRAASIADSLGDLQNFLNDLIKTVEQTEELSQTDPAQTVKIFIDLVQRHEQSFYSFVHNVHSKGEGLFTGLMRWIELFLTLMRDGVGERISLEFLLPHTGADRENIMREVDEVARYHYKLKVAYEAKLRRRFGRTQGMHDADAEDEATAQLVEGIVRDLSFGDLVKDNADDLAAEVDDDEESSDDESESGSGTSSSGSQESDSGESETDSENSGGGSDTERDGTPYPIRVRSEGPPPVQRPPTRSHIVAHSPVQGKFVQRKKSLSRLFGGGRHSADALRPDPPPPLPTRERSQTVSMSKPSSPSPSSSRFKDLPPHPGSKDKELPPPPSAAPPTARQQEKQAARTPGQPGRSKSKSPTSGKKAPAGPKPPQLEHISKLLPLFVEVMRPHLMLER